MASPAESAPAARPMNLPWNQEAHYWICVIPHPEAPQTLPKALQAAGMQKSGGAYLFEAPRMWGESWQKIRAALASCAAMEAVDIAVVGSGPAPDAAHIVSLAMSVAKADDISGSLWLGEAIVEGRVLCYLQPVLTGRDKIFGYEAFARVRRETGEITGGGDIVKAGRSLNIEYALDRHLQVEAIKTFAGSGCGGFLFVNFLPSFIQRPEVYLDGLSQTARANGIVPKHLVLDFSRSGAEHDAHHLKRVCGYCRSKGYAVALDDLDSPTTAQMLINEIHPDYVKLDIKLVLRAAKGGDIAPEYETIRNIVQECHAHGVVVIAEGVETEASFEALKRAEVDLFQGYLFSPPVPVEEARRLSQNGA